MKCKPAAEIAAFLQPIARSLGAEVLEVKWTHTNGCALNVTIDAPGGVDLKLCEAFHRAIDFPLDELDPSFGAPYTLNCSSAGLDRPFQTAADYLRHLGEKVEISLYAKEDGEKVYEGELVSFDGEAAVLITKKGEKRFELGKIAKACLFVEV